MTEEQKEESITVDLPDLDVKNLENMVKINYVKNRSQAIRKAITQFSPKARKMQKQLGGN
ncbi:hypothetical protein [Candidatus Lokiarchaeum ossiferum]|uniref:hypothetical protein n=1 Tax=Candidatus Lokiarchaeum ossiferum TaxID=2951803 RepID=UPI00352DC0C2